MALADLLNDDLKRSMKDRDTVRVSVLRMVKAAVKNAEIGGGRPLTDDEILGVMRREVKERNESLEAFRKSSREDLIAASEAELAVLYSYLPAPLTDDEITEIVREVVAAVGARSKADIGKVMPVAMARIGLRGDGRTVNRVVQEILSQP